MPRIEEVSCEKLDRIYKNTPEDEKAWIEGLITGLLHAQAYADRPRGQQTLKTHLPEERYDGKGWRKVRNLPRKILAAILELDDGGIIDIRFVKEHPWWARGKEDMEDVRQLVVEIGSSEGYFGLPEWES